MLPAVKFGPHSPIGSIVRGVERSAGAIAMADEQVLWTCQSDERREHERAAG